MTVDIVEFVWVHLQVIQLIDVRWIHYQFVSVTADHPLWIGEMVAMELSEYHI